jgi:[ribosomal protein S5]-alanine N-acetyltransferase
MPARRESRVILRHLSPGDQNEFIAAMQASRRLHGRWLSPPTTPDAFGEWLRRTREESFESLLPCRREDGAIVGYFNISQIIRGYLQSAFLGYGAVAAHAGRGYMTEGLELVLEHAFTKLDLHRLEANIQPGNEPSIALVRRCGFVKEGFSERYLKINGRWRDHERWAIRSEQWRDQRRRSRR